MCSPALRRTWLDSRKKSSRPSRRKFGAGAGTHTLAAARWSPTLSSRLSQPGGGGSAGRRGRERRWEDVWPAISSWEFSDFRLTLRIITFWKSSPIQLLSTASGRENTHPSNSEVPTASAGHVSLCEVCIRLGQREKNEDRGIKKEIAE